MNTEEHIQEVKHRRMMITNEKHEESERKVLKDGYHDPLPHHHLSDALMRKQKWLQIIFFLKAVRFISIPIVDMRIIKAADVRR